LRKAKRRVLHLATTAFEKWMSASDFLDRSSLILRHVGEEIRLRKTFMMGIVIQQKLRFLGENNPKSS
jgi:hypothetical protein